MIRRDCMLFPTWFINVNVGNQSGCWAALDIELLSLLAFQ